MAIKSASTPTGRTRSFLLTFCVLAFFGVLVFAGCGDDDDDGGGGGGGDDGAASGEPVLVGASTARTGFMNQFDLPALAGAKLAIEDINKDGGLLGRQLELADFDSKTEKAQNAAAAEQALSAGAEVLFSSCDLDFGGPGALLADQADTIVLGCAGDPRFGRQGIGPNTFTFTLLAPLEGAAGAEWAYNEKDWRRAYLLVDDFLEYSKSVGSYFENRWNELPDTEIVSSDTFAQDQSSFGAQVSRLRANLGDADFIYMPTCAPGGATLLRQIRAAGIDVPVVSDNCMMGDEWTKSVPDLTNYWATSNLAHNGDDPNEEINEFWDRFMPICESELDGACPTAQFGVVGYSMIQGWAEAVRQAESFDTAEVRAALEGFSDEPLLIGETTFSKDLHADVDRDVMILEVQGDGKHSATDLGYFSLEETPRIEF